MTEWKKNAVHPLRIEGYTAEGMGVARLEGRVVFVPFTAQGELWRVRLEKVRPHMAWGRGLELLEPSPERSEADCPLFSRCGGCQFRHLTYAEELRAKGQRIADALERVGGVRLALPPVLGAESPDRYRNKVQFPVAPGRRGPAVGYYRPRSHDVLDVADCLLQPETVTALRLAFLGWMEDFHVPPYEETSRSGLIRHLYVRTNRAGEALCCVVANGSSLPHTHELVRRLREVRTADLTEQEGLSREHVRRKAACADAGAFETEAQRERFGVCENDVPCASSEAALRKAQAAQGRTAAQKAAFPRLLAGALRRTKATAPQSALSAEERYTNLADAFAAAPAFLPRLAGARVLLLDDVYTTGATANQCAKTLKEAGAAAVHLVALATGNHYASGHFAQ